MERGKTSTKCAGIDVSKRWLDASVHGVEGVIRVANAAAGWSELIGWLGEQGVTRAGLEASGGYERQVRTALEAAGLEVVVHQPLEVRLFARLKRLRAKNDRLDAALIAAATAQTDAVKAAADPRLQELAERLTAYEQVTDQLAELKAFMEHVRLKDVAAALRAQIRSLAALIRTLEKPPPLPGLTRLREGDDHRALLALANDPAIAGPGRCRMDACVQLPAGFGLVHACPQPLLHKRIPGRWVARLRYDGPAAHIGEGWRALLHQWLPQAAYQLAIGPFHERYDPAFGVPGTRHVRCELAMPVEPRVA